MSKRKQKDLPKEKQCSDKELKAMGEELVELMMQNKGTRDMLHCSMPLFLHVYELAQKGKHLEYSRSYLKYLIRKELKKICRKERVTLKAHYRDILVKSSLEYLLELRKSQVV